MKAKVWNDNKFVHKEKFRGDMVTIPPGEFIEMDYMDAVQFRGQMTPISRDVDGAPTPKSFKMIRLEVVPDKKKVEFDNLVCQSCSYKAADQVDLAKHTLENHSESLAEKSRDEAGKKLQEALKRR